MCLNYVGTDTLASGSLHWQVQLFQHESLCVKVEGLGSEGSSACLITGKAERKEPKLAKIERNS